MTVRELSEQLGCEAITGEAAADQAVTGCYCGDLLSWVMSRVRKGDAWITVMGNINTIAVASLAETSCLILAENAALDAQAQEKAAENGVVVLRSPKTAAQLVFETMTFLAKTAPV